ncbi:DUF819 family protein [Psychrobium sp. MM17-31]|uniref:DUF819 family protein n=1 Tax=Psychrobium sp. MM17-31 TaxID=2917758 RepID=UPI001EF507BA|nr:DUF819 family protein [Psychrobium sp. MM17-31]MCG7531266.1 DUF819 family protein [Psychrobium sp. MM17-31]
MNTALITNDAVVLGLLATILGGVFYASNHPTFKKIFTYVPALLFCYFLPSLLNTFGIVDGDASQVYYIASRYLLPACLVLLLLNLDLKAIFNLGPKAVIMFLTGTLGIVIGGPIALLIMSAVSPEIIGVDGPNAVWRGMTTVAGSWIGGGANQAAMKEVYEVGGDIFSAMVTVDIIVANVWMAVILILAGNAKKIDAKTGADTSAIDALREKAEAYKAANDRNPSLTDLMLIVAIGFGFTALAHIFADTVTPYFVENHPELKKLSFHSKFFWLIVSVSIMGLILSFTKARNLEAVGASKVGTIYLYILVASIGLHMDVLKIFNAFSLFVLGGIWMLVHAVLMLTVAKLIKAPLFFMAVGSQANVGGAASAPVVASAFHPALAPVGVLLAVFGYLLGTFAAWFCGQILQVIAVA